MLKRFNTNICKHIYLINYDMVSYLGFDDVKMKAKIVKVYWTKRIRCRYGLQPLSMFPLPCYRWVWFIAAYFKSFQALIRFHIIPRTNKSSISRIFFLRFFRFPLAIQILFGRLKGLSTIVAKHEKNITHILRYTHRGTNTCKLS